MKSDGDLLRDFAHSYNQACFTELVRRHIKFVYAVSLRRTQDAAAAQDATQAVFIALARKARSVAQVPSVVGWLHRSACYQTQYLMRSQKNRVARETEAHRLGTTLVDSRRELEELGAVLDEVLCELPDKDREAIIDRYFGEHTYANIGAKFRLTENAARMRVDRALQQLRGLLERRGISSSAAALATALPAYASAQEPAGLVATIAKASALAAASGAGGAIIFMTTTKVIAGFVVAASVTGFFWEKTRNDAFEKQLALAHAELSATDQRLQSMEAEMRDLRKARKEMESKLATSAVGSA